MTRTPRRRRRRSGGPAGQARGRGGGGGGGVRARRRPVRPGQGLRGSAAGKIPTSVQPSRPPVSERGGGAGEAAALLAAALVIDRTRPLGGGLDHQTVSSQRGAFRRSRSPSGSAHSQANRTLTGSSSYHRGKKHVKQENAERTRL